MVPPRPAHPPHQHSNLRRLISLNRKMEEGILRQKKLQVRKEELATEEGFTYYNGVLKEFRRW